MKETPLRPAASLASPSQDPAAAARAVRCACACRAARRPLPPAPEGPRGLRARRSPGVSCLGPSGGDRARRSWRATGQAVHGAAPEARAGERRRRRNGTRAARMGEATRVTTGRGAAARRVPCSPLHLRAEGPNKEECMQSLPYPDFRAREVGLQPPCPSYVGSTPTAMSSSGGAGLPRNQFGPVSVGSAHGCAPAASFPLMHGTASQTCRSHAPSGREISFPGLRCLESWRRTVGFVFARH